MNKAAYAEYIASPDWRARREGLIEAHGSRCARCGIPRGLAQLFDREDLNFHHFEEGYARLGEETPADGEPLCKPCHGWEKFKAGQRTHRSELEWAAIGWWCWATGCNIEGSYLDKAVEPYVASWRKYGLYIEEIDHVFAEWMRRRGYRLRHGIIEAAEFDRACAEMRSRRAA